MSGDFNFENSKQFKTRAVGKLFMGPLEGAGYNNRVLELTANEIEFKNSESADRFMDLQRKKYASRSQLGRCNRLKFLAKLDD